MCRICKIKEAILVKQFTDTLIEGIKHVDKQMNLGFTLEAITAEMKVNIINLPSVKNNSIISDAFIALIVSFYEAGANQQDPSIEDYNYFMGLIFDEVGFHKS